jgi:hypothetical protein
MLFWITRIMIMSDSGEVNFALRRLAVHKIMTRHWRGCEETSGALGEILIR